MKVLNHTIEILKNFFGLKVVKRKDTKLPSSSIVIPNWNTSVL